MCAGFSKRHVAPSRRAASLTAVVLLTGMVGCSQMRVDDTPEAKAAPAKVYVLAPVLNLSGSNDFDALRVTDLIASECLSFEGLSIVPVNLTLAELARVGKPSVETPEDAVQLARTFGADGTLVVAITEYDPYDPPVIGMILQVYEADRVSSTARFDPLTASRSSQSPELALSVAPGLTPRWQIQRVFNAASEDVQNDIRRYAEDREGHRSAYGWRKTTKCQEEYVRYCGWALIRSMLLLDQVDRAASRSHEAKS